MAFVYGSTVFIESSASVYVETLYNNVVYPLAANSIVIVQSGKTTWNSSLVPTVNVKRIYTDQWPTLPAWQAWHEPTYPGPAYNLVFSPLRSSSASDLPPNPITIYSDHPLEQLNITRDLTDYLWYTTQVHVTNPPNPMVFHIDAATAAAFQLWIDDTYIGDCYDQTHGWVTTNHSCEITIPFISTGGHTISLLSTAIGIENGMNSDEQTLDTHFKGVRSGGGIKIGQQDITSGKWIQRSYTDGQIMQIYTDGGRNRVPWDPKWTSYLNLPTTWFTANFVTPTLPSFGLFSVLIDITGLGRGHLYINGHDVAHYWSILGKGTPYPTQRYYYVPIDWLMPAGGSNSITIYEELGATNLKTVTLVISQQVRTEPDIESRQEVELLKAKTE